MKKEKSIPDIVYDYLPPVLAFFVILLISVVTGIAWLFIPTFLIKKYKVLDRFYNGTMPSDVDKTEP